MRCSYCDAPDTKVIDSRLLLEGFEVRRRRECERCGKRFTTYERKKQEMPWVIKNSGSKELYSRDKIYHGLKKALRKLPQDAEAVEYLVDSIENSIMALGSKIITTEQIGEVVMKHLKEFDPVAYVRFASVYWEFKEIEDFVSVLNTSLKTKDKK